MRWPATATLGALRARIRRFDVMQADIPVAQAVIRRPAEQVEQIGDDRRLVLGVAPRPRPRLDFEEVAGARRSDQAVEVDVELDALVRDQPSPAILLDRALLDRTEI